MNENAIREEIEQGLLQVDPALSINDMVFTHSDENRSLKVSFTAQSEDTEALEVSVEW